MATVKPEMKSYIWVQTVDGSMQQVEEDFITISPLIRREVLLSRKGSSKNNAILLPEKVTPAALGSILDYVRFHQAPGRSNKERRTFNEKFVRTDVQRVCDLASASHCLEIEPLVDLTARSLARIIEANPIEKIRQIFNVPDDLTEEEKLEPLNDFGDDPRIRLLNRLYAKKRNELKEREKNKNVQKEPEHVDERSVDDLVSFINGGSTDSTGCKKTKNKKKNRRKKDSPESSTSNAHGDHQKEFDAHSSNQNSVEINDTVSSPSSTSEVKSPGNNFLPVLECDDVDSDGDLDPERKAEIDRAMVSRFDTHSSNQNSVEINDTVSSPSSTSEVKSPGHNFLPVLECDDVDCGDDLDPERKAEIDRAMVSRFDAHSSNQNSVEINDTVSSPSSTSEVKSPDNNFLPMLECDDVDSDDDLDPERKAEIDREVEDFARRLNSDWSERMQEIFSLGQQKRLLPLTTNGRGRST